MPREKLMFLLLLSALLLPTGCMDDNPNRAVDRKDSGFLRLDGGGPMMKPDMPGAPQPDTGGTVPGKTTMGKFCHNATYKGNNLTLTAKLGSGVMTAVSYKCSPCVKIAVGTQALQLYSGSQYLGAAQTTVKEGFEYAYLAKVNSKGQMSLSKDELDVSKGDTCDKHQPNL